MGKERRLPLSKSVFSEDRKNVAFSSLLFLLTPMSFIESLGIIHKNY